ncbi:MAG: hypothetical protein Q8885_01410 [Candidatus Phytoplasma stylosanthis]|nr:hypothetical protein [Candidatus Phytoplasma stylosanthis]
MNIFFKKKEKKNKLFSFIFNSAIGEPFRTEKYDNNGEEKKIEFFSLEKSKYSHYFLDMKQYVIWSILGNVCRVFIQDSYYKEFKILYQKEINVLYIEFLEKILKRSYEISKKNNFYFFSIIFLSYLFSFFLSYKFILENFFFFYFLFTFILIFSFLFLNIKQKKNLKNYKQKKFEEMIQKVKLFLGEEIFSNVIEKQKEYFSKLKI